MKILVHSLALLSVASAWFYGQEMWDCTARKLETPFIIEGYTIVRMSPDIYRCPWKCFPSRSITQEVDIQIVVGKNGEKEWRKAVFPTESGCFFHDDGFH